MSEILINEYLRAIDSLCKVSGSKTEQVIREAFKDLLKRWSKAQGLSFVAELEVVTAFGMRVVPDRTVLHALRVP